MQNEKRLRELRDTIKCNNSIIGITEGKEREKEEENLLEDIIAENIPDWGKKETSRFRKHRELQTRRTRGGPRHDM